MLYVARHLASFLALPFAVTVLVPRYVERRWPPSPCETTALGASLFGIGVLVGGVGLGLFVSSLHHFFTRGRGTLAPWDPPQRLVVSGPYRFVRNPMISGVIFVLFSEAFLLRSLPLLAWAGTFLAMNLVYIPLIEEPGLAARFGAAYDEYCKHVRRFLPRLRPWTP
jgi:protein-S-isoprenylcysteine O-methyltransferase Ste14